ncbi:MAG: hypothetical protein OXC37_02030 [Bdellovibrionaceae bacterium]|nr:hypothetical protein [Pseudobdellovibrionaceae bacterium]
MKFLSAFWFLFLLESVCFAEHTKTKEQLSSINLIARNTSTFDPFIDYGEFEDNITEEESINFFQYGRSFSVSLAGGYEAITFNIRQIYGDTFFAGANVTFFLDLHFAIQLSGVFPSGHYNSLFNTSFPFSHYGLDLKYYWNRQYLNKDKDFFSPYVIFGPFHLNIKSSLPTGPNTNLQNPPQATNNLSSIERQAIASYNATGVKIGFGFEFALIQQSFIGFELSYLYTVLQSENEDLSGQNFPPLVQTANNQTLLQRLQFPNRPEVRGYRFYGDLMNIGIVFGVNF